MQSVYTLLFESNMVKVLKGEAYKVYHHVLVSALSVGGMEEEGRVCLYFYSSLTVYIVSTPVCYTY